MFDFKPRVHGLLLTYTSDFTWWCLLLRTERQAVMLTGKAMTSSYLLFLNSYLFTMSLLLNVFAHYLAEPIYIGRVMCREFECHEDYTVHLHETRIFYTQLWLSSLDNKCKCQILLYIYIYIFRQTAIALYLRYFAPASIHHSATSTFHLYITELAPMLHLYITELAPM